jgi:hypothetical protein
VDRRTETIGRNEALFREVNERIRQVTQEFLRPPPLEILCECGNAECTERITVSVEDYEQVRADGATFMVVKGHQIPDTEFVVEERPGYDVVRKKPGGPGELARALDPRS